MFNLFKNKKGIIKEENLTYNSENYLFKSKKEHEYSGDLEIYKIDYTIRKNGECYTGSIELDEIIPKFGKVFKIVSYPVPCGNWSSKIIFDDSTKMNSDIKEINYHTVISKIHSELNLDWDKDDICILFKHKQTFERGNNYIDLRDGDYAKIILENGKIINGNLRYNDSNCYEPDGWCIDSSEEFYSKVYKIKAPYIENVILL